MRKAVSNRLRSYYEAIKAIVEIDSEDFYLKVTRQAGSRPHDGRGPA